ncbi:MAG: 50S ribosomal protein L24 [Promethearchaeota archaeon CR_4]|nr:ribosomal protein L24 [uncultured bacterium]OLS16165.1 MAG: 50S ribosomal protein L24 [Candidatus Lokiarchaeota archaeon CR_4]
MRVQSKKPGKQRKALYNVKNNLRSAALNCALDESLRQQVGIRRLPLRKDDRVRVTSGEFKDIEGKVLKLNKNKRTITVEECVNEKKDGSSIYLPIAISRVRIVKLAEKKPDPWRQKIMDRRAKIWKEVTEVTGPKKAKQIEKETGVE